MGFGALTSLTGGGDLASSSSASADGDASSSNGAFNYRTGVNSNNNMLIIGAIAIAALFFIKRK